MGYKVIKPFKDKEDNNKKYKAGDVYPKGEYKPTKKRLEELSEIHPRYNTAFIEEVKEEEKKTSSTKKK